MKQLSQKAHAAAFHAEFFGNTTQKRFVLGINEFADAVANRTNLDGFIDEYTTATEYRGKPVLKLAQVPAGSMVISTVTQARPKTAMNKLLRLNGVVSMDYFAVADASHFQLPQVQALADTQKEYASHPEKFEWVRDLFADQESREVFNRVMEFRLNANLRAMRFFDYTADQQYFEPFVNFEPGEVFVDGGGFDGYTTEEFIKRCPQYGSVHFFEPTETTLIKAKAQLSKHRDIHFHPVGLLDTEQTLSFDADAGSACKISETGNVQINVDALDNRVTESVSFIKLDLEGAEPKALEGMKWHIQEDHPKLAVAVYHDPAHFWQVPEIILGVRNDYKVYLRHYTEGWTETVMFFIPK
jgi:FkbM family methyltransferase